MGVDDGTMPAHVAGRRCSRTAGMRGDCAVRLVLLVEDNELNQEVATEQLLGDAGWSVWTWPAMALQVLALASAMRRAMIMTIWC